MLFACPETGGEVGLGMASKLIRCRSCSAAISRKAASCPHCGHAYRKPGGIDGSDPVHVVGIIAAILLAIYLALNFVASLAS